MTSTVFLPQRQKFIADNWYQPVAGVVVTGSTITPANSIRLIPFVLPQSVSISDLGCHVTTLAAGGNCQLAIYANDASNRPAGAALASTGDISTAATGAISASITGGPVTLPAGYYWMAIVVDATAAGTVIFQNLSAATAHMTHIVGSSTLANVSAAASTAGLRLSVSNPSAYGTWPDLTGETFAESSANSGGLVFYKVSAIP